MPPKDETYEYIIFRGSDIKDITVSEPPKSQHGLPCDPAIIQVCVCDSGRFGLLLKYFFHFMMYLFFVCFSKSSLGSSSAAYHPRWSPYRDMMPTYNQLAASSLLNQQYSAALGLGKIHDALDRSDV